MLTLVLNLGSSSLKYRLFGKNEKLLSHGIVDKIGQATEERFDGKTDHKFCKDHEDAFAYVESYLLNKKVVRSTEDIALVAHRVVHGGEFYNQAVVIDKKVLANIQKLFDISPLHNPINHKGILLSQKYFPQAKQVAVFDTAFYHGLLPKAYLYALPYRYYKKHQLRKYGFHGTSHKYIDLETMQYLKRKNLRHISCHLGNGSSITAILNGKAVDTSMGFTPLDGLMMGTRSGSVDPAIIPYLEQHEHLSISQIDEILTKESGILGVSELSSDMRDIYQASLKGNKRAHLVMSMLSYQIAKYIGQMAAVLGGVDVITFTGGIGENAFYIREMALKNLAFLGVKLDPARNKKNALEISAKDSKVKVLVVPTDEELQIYREARELLKKK